jgi:hypothetical protein
MDLMEMDSHAPLSFTGIKEAPDGMDTPHDPLSLTEIASALDEMQYDDKLSRLYELWREWHQLYIYLHENFHKEFSEQQQFNDEQLEHWRKHLPLHMFPAILGQNMQAPILEHEQELLREKLYQQLREQLHAQLCQRMHEPTQRLAQVQMQLRSMQEQIQKRERKMQIY